MPGKHYQSGKSRPRRKASAKTAGTRASRNISTMKAAKRDAAEGSYSKKYKRKK